MRFIIFLVVLLSMIILQHIKERRKKKGYNQKYMADQLHISASGYAKIESGENVLSVERFLDICRILEVNSYNQVLPAINEDSVEEIEKILLTAGMAFKIIHHNAMHLVKLIDQLQENYKIQEPAKSSEFIGDIDLIIEYLKTISSESSKNGYSLTSIKELIELID